MIFNINFFLFSFAQSNIYCYTFVFANYYSGVSKMSYGVFCMVLPLLILVVKPMSCSIADANSKHKEVLIFSLALFGLSYGSLGFIPFIKDVNNHETDDTCWMFLIGIMTIGSLACSCVFCMNDALASNYARKHNKSYSRMRIFACTGWSAGALLLLITGQPKWLPYMVLNCALLGLFIFMDIAILLLWPYDEDFQMFHDGSTVEQRKLSIVGPNTIALLANMKHRGSISHDMIERIRAGRSKSVGYIPKVQTFDLKLEEQQDEFNKKEQPKEKKEYSNFQCQMMLIKLIATSHKSLARYVFLFTVFGIVQGIIWVYSFDYFKEEIAKTPEEFNLISTLCMIAQSWAGEILINIVATDMLRLFGSNANLSLALVCLGLRCYAYANILPFMGLYSVILVEALQGPSLGLYWVLTVDIGSNYALMVTDFMPEMRRRGMIRDKQHEEELGGCSRATMIGIMSSSMEGLGVALGAFIGGTLSSSLGYKTMWNICAIIGFLAGFINIGWDLVRKLEYGNNGSNSKKQSNIPIPTVVIEDSNFMNLNGTKL